MMDSLTVRESKDSKILCVGLICFDIVQLCEKYPEENTDQRCIDLKYQRGGNASNSCTVISQLGYPVELLGILGSDEFSKFLADDLRKRGIEFGRCPVRENCGSPVSTVMLSAKTGSRTILHHRTNIGDVSLRDFEKLHLREYSWIHFEGRSLVNILAMIEHIKKYNESSIDSSINYSPITISVELEKINHDLLQLLSHADVAFVSKEFAQSRGCNDMIETIESLNQYSKPGGTIINPWGELGAMAIAPDKSIVQSPAFPPEKAIDSLGAGDTFNGAILFYLSKRKLTYDKDTSRNEFIDQDVLRKAITFGCRIAGAKVGLRGYENLGAVYESLRSTCQD